MASIHQDATSKVYRIRFRFQGRNINRSLRTKDGRSARATCARVEDTLRLIEQGRVEVPVGDDPIEFVLADGRTTKRQQRPKATGLSQLFAMYENTLPPGHKEHSTIAGERIHLTHLERHLGPNRTVQAITTADLQQYVSKRLGEQYRGRPIRPDTVRKELVTFRMLWNWAVEQGLLVGRSPTKNVSLPLTDEKPPFMTRSEIKRIIARGGLSEQQEATLWESAYLESDELKSVLGVIERLARHPFIYPMAVFVGHTGTRRSEIVRSRVEDIDLESRTVAIREKKKSRTKAMTYRRVDMSPLLYMVMRDWIIRHPGGQHTFCQGMPFGQARPLTSWQAHHHLKKTLETSEWSFIRGFHIFRHSFASNLAAVGVDQRVIDDFMGHQTEEMRRRYRHLFPAQRRAAIEAAFGSRIPPGGEGNNTEPPVLYPEHLTTIQGGVPSPHLH